MIISVVLTFFLLMGVVGAVDTTNVSVTEDSNLDDDASALSTQNKLEISNEDSISQTNIVNSHDDNLEEHSSYAASSSDVDSDYEDSGFIKSSFVNVSEEDNLALPSSSDNDVVAGSSDGNVISASSSDNDVVASSSDSNIISASSSNSDVLSASKKVSTKLSVSDTSYSKSGTVFKVTLKDSSGKTLTNQKVSLKVNGKTFSAATNKNGIALIKANALAIGSYTVSLSYAGDSSYSSSSLSKKIKVLSSVKGNDITKYYGYKSVYKATFLKDGGALANTKVSFKIDGKTYTRTTDKNGVAKLNVYLKVGKHVISSTNPYSKQKLSNTVVVKKDKSIIKHSPAKTYIVPNKKYVFTVTLKSKHDVKLKQGRIYFTYNNKTVTALTNKNGKASITIPALSNGTYKIRYNFYGSEMFYASSGSCMLYVAKPVNSFQASSLKMTYKDGSKFSVKLKNSENAGVGGKKIKFIIDGKTYHSKTNSKGVAKLSVGSLKPGTYKVKYSFSSLGSKYYASGSKKVTVSKAKAYVTAKDFKMKYNSGASYKVKVKTKSGKALKNVKVKFTVGGKSYTAKTNSKGVAKVPISLKVGYYPIKVAVKDSYYKSSTVSKHVLVNGVKFVAKQLYVTVGKSASYSVKVVNGKNNPIKNAKVSFTLNGKTYSAKTGSKGVAKVKVGVLSKGVHTIKFKYKSTSGSSKIHVVNKITIKQIIAASKTVKKYIENNEKLPSSVKIGGVKYSVSDYFYFASKAIINLKSGSKADILIKKVSSPSKPGAASYAGNLYDYLSVAKSVVKTADSKGKMPNSVSSKVGTIGYKGLVYAFARVVAFYGDEKVMPNYVTIKAFSTSTTSKLNSKNTISNLVSYLAASKNCQVNNAKIKKLVAKLTKGLTSDKAKAKAIFNYVRDTISYSFYYDTKHGAVGTLDAKSGNCVDHAHLLVAMYRAAKLPARYVHGTCTFSSGGTYGHVWAQVLIGNTWTVSDATSTRNSLGNVVNWNSNSYSLHGYYSSLSF